MTNGETELDGWVNFGACLAVGGLGIMVLCGGIWAVALIFIKHGFPDAFFVLAVIGLFVMVFGLLAAFATLAVRLGWQSLTALISKWRI